MRPVIYALLFLLISVVRSSGQQTQFPPCSLPMDWDQIVETNAPMPEGIEKLLLVTTRAYTPDDPYGELIQNDLAEYRKVTYFLAACDGEKWLLKKVDGFSSGMEAIDDGRDLLLFVHGHGKSTPAALTRANQIQDRYDVSMILFDWPSYNSNFNKSLSRVRRCGENYYNLLLQLQDYREQKLQPGQHMSMLLHSLGNYFLTHLVVNGNNQYLDGKIFDNIIMNSAAVRSKEHGAVISQLHIQDNLYVILNSRDKVLRGAHLLTTGKMLGNIAIEPLAPQATYVDFTCVAGTQHTYFAGYHQFEFDLPAFDQVFSTSFHGGKVDFSNKEMFSKMDGQAFYMVNDPVSGCPD